MSRIVGGQMLLGDREKEVLRRLLWRVADFQVGGADCITIMSNHPCAGTGAGRTGRSRMRNFCALRGSPRSRRGNSVFARFETALREGTDEAVKWCGEALLAGCMIYQS